MTNPNPKFPKIGKELPYNVPNDFFDKLPEKTLQLAKIRMESNRRKNRTIRFFAVISAAAAIILLLLVTPSRDMTPKNHLMAALKKNKTKTNEKAILPKALPKKSIQVKVVEKKLNKESATFSTQTESIDDILQGLSDDELAQLTAMYSSEDLPVDLSQVTNTIN
ncbi:MAG TPA: hypothetical protein VFP20_05500 [Bacteroidales bacterium]|nr:hypothetical protein [Bacteroidales bacterium]